MDIKARVEDLAEQIRKNPALLKEFRESPVKAVEAIVGRDLPDAQINQRAELVKAKLDLDKAGDLLKGLGGLFQK